jgi:hypothetical protein
MDLKIPSAIVDRHMFPRQTNRTDIGSEAMFDELCLTCKEEVEILLSKWAKLGSGMKRSRSKSREGGEHSVG